MARFYYEEGRMNWFSTISRLPRKRAIMIEVVQRVAKKIHPFFCGRRDILSGGYAAGTLSRGGKSQY